MALHGVQVLRALIADECALPRAAGWVEHTSSWPCSHLLQTRPWLVLAASATCGSSMPNGTVVDACTQHDKLLQASSAKAATGGAAPASCSSQLRAGARSAATGTLQCSALRVRTEPQSMNT